MTELSLTYLYCWRFEIKAATIGRECACVGRKKQKLWGFGEQIS
jgi:hypothetical protein